MGSIIDYYTAFDEWGRLDREPLEFQINWHYIQKYLPSSGHILDNGAGPGKYAMRLAQAGHTVTLTDLVPRLVEVAKEKAVELSVAEQFADFHVADARDLSHFSDEVFDASLALGPMYHLQEKEDRNKAIKELYRVTKKDGFVFVAFMPRVRHVLNSLRSPLRWKPNHEAENLEKFSETGIFNHADEGRFTGAYYFNVEEIAPFMEQHGFETVQLIGSSNLGGLMTEEEMAYWQERGEAQHMMNVFIEAAKDPALLGVSTHLLYIGRRIGWSS
ncbi:class I SAM-dependent methyltransferase [Priestia koreensis]|uniref:class I SAM-dependent methyltransferase n=1 Tax=Priestia koreensis TaxID=284581 RepID=UPI001F55DF78|nr:class I SAM-dependent methyltransferase [Priestia koreensis]UNL83046.1 class I SAM-dependent methyltransferase [Priestia koreensis]